MMHSKGLTKLMEECGELIQIAAKKAAYIDTDGHHDGQGSMKNRLENEIGDVLAAIAFVIDKFDLNIQAITNRRHAKLEQFRDWDGWRNPYEALAAREGNR